MKTALFFASLVFASVAWDASAGCNRSDFNNVVRAVNQAANQFNENLGQYKSACLNDVTWSCEEYKAAFASLDRWSGEAAAIEKEFYEIALNAKDAKYRFDRLSESCSGKKIAATARNNAEQVAEVVDKSKQMTKRTMRCKTLLQSRRTKIRERCESLIADYQRKDALRNRMRAEGWDGEDSDLCVIDNTLPGCY